jgi:hypothetical protein
MALTDDNAFANLAKDAPQEGAPSSLPPENAFGHLADGQEQPKMPPQPKAGAFLSSKVGRLLQGAAEPAMGLVQGASHLTGYGTERADAAAQKLANLYQASRREAGIKPEDWDYWAGAGNVVSPINAIPGGLIAKGLGPAKTMLGLAGRGAATGAAYGATQPVSDLGAGETYAGKKSEQVGMGAATGAVMGPAAGAIAGAVKPEVTEAAQKLMAEGVELTPGQMLGGNWKRLEDVAAKTPLVGSWIREAQGRSLESFNKAAANRALAPIGESVSPGVKMGHDVIQHVEEKLSNAYDEVHPKLSATFDDQFHKDIAAINAATQAPGASLPAAQKAQFEGMVNGLIDRAGPNATDTLTGETVHGVSSALAKEAAGYASDQNFDNRKLGAALGSVKDAFDAMLERQNPQYAQELNKINTGWANYVRLRQAASSVEAGNREGVFTSAQLSRASKAMDRTAGKGATAKGEALYQDLAEAGRQTLPQSLPDSGTAERLTTNAILAGHAIMSPASAAAHALIPGLYSKVGLDFARKALTARPGGAQAISDVLRKYAPVQGTQSALSLTGQEKP